jgi:hypothetical protein
MRAANKVTDTGLAKANNSDEERVELDPKSHPLLRVTAASSISRIPRLAVDVAILVRRWLVRTSIAGAVLYTQGAERQNKGTRTRKARKTISSTEWIMMLFYLHSLRGASYADRFLSK